MEEVGVEDTRQRLSTVDIRILSEKKKSSYRTARVKGFPVTGTCEDFRKAVENVLPGERFVHNFSFGFIDKQKKIWAVSESDLADAYAAAINGQALWVDPSQTVVMNGDSNDKQGNKRPHDEMTATSSSITENIEGYTRSLKEKHGESYQPYQYRLWAEMLALGSHKSEDEAPMLPIFRNKMAKKAQPAAGPSTSTMGASVSGYSRADVLQQLRELNELKQMGVLTGEEFANKKKVLLNDLT